LPYILDIHVGLGIDLGGEAVVGPATLSNLEIDGTYSTGPAVLNHFEVTGKFQFSAQAALVLKLDAHAVSLLKRKIDCGDIQSAAGVEKWENALTHLIASPFGEMYVEKIRARDIEGWKGEVAVKVNAQQYAPSTFNTWLGLLKVVLEHAKRELELPQNAARDVQPLDLSRHRVYRARNPTRSPWRSYGTFSPPCTRTIRSTLP
jgi:hypothetical protein